MLYPPIFTDLGLLKMAPRNVRVQRKPAPHQHPPELLLLAPPPCFLTPGLVPRHGILMPQVFLSQLTHPSCIYNPHSATNQSLTTPWTVGIYSPLMLFFLQTKVSSIFPGANFREKDSCKSTSSTLGMEFWAPRYSENGLDRKQQL